MRGGRENGARVGRLHLEMLKIRTLSKCKSSGLFIIYVEESLFGALDSLACIAFCAAARDMCVCIDSIYRTKMVSVVCLPCELNRKITSNLVLSCSSFVETSHLCTINAWQKFYLFSLPDASHCVMPHTYLFGRAINVFVVAEVSLVNWER